MTDHQPARRRAMTTRRPKGANGDGGITFDKAKTRYVARYTDPRTGKREKLTQRAGESLDDLRKRLRAAQVRAEQGLPPEPTTRLTLAAFLAEWLREIVKPHTRTSTYDTYAQAVRLYLVPRLGRVLVRELTTAHIQRFTNELAATVGRRGRVLSPLTVERVLRTLRTALAHAHRTGLTAHNPAAGRLVRTPKAARRRPPPLTPERAQEILEAFAEHRLYAAVLLSLTTGMRQGEVLGLRWSDVEIDRPGRRAVVRVQTQVQRLHRQIAFTPTKSETSRRTLVLPPEVVDELRRQRTRVKEMRLAAGERWRDHDLVFPSEVGTPLFGPNTTRAFQRVLARAGLPPMRWHDLRHGFAAVVLTHGGTLKQAQAALGHSQIALTADLYGNVAEEALADVSDRVSGALFRRAR